MKVHALQTGTVRIKEAQRVGRGHGPLRLVNVLASSRWTEPLPIYAWLIEHPDGLIVVDTGERAAAMRPGYFPAWHPYYRSVMFDIAPEDEIGPQLRRMGVNPHKDVRHVVLTHLHTDHIGGLHHFPKSTVWLEPRAYRAASGPLGRPSGYLPQHWPRWLEPSFVPFSQDDTRWAGASFSLTKDGAVSLVPTPGHTPHHL
jgi:N-acyl homoserine lactone hydrolase